MSKKTKPKEEANPEVQKSLEEMYKNVELDAEKKKEIEKETSMRQEKLVEEIQNSPTMKDYLIKLWESHDIMHEDQKSVTKHISEINEKIDQELRNLQLKIAPERKDINLVTYNYKMEKFEEMKIKHQLKDAENLKKNLAKKLKTLEADIDVMKSFKEWGHNKNDIHASIDMDEQRREEMEAKIKSIMKERNLISRERREKIEKMEKDIAQAVEDDKKRKKQEKQEELERMKAENQNKHLKLLKEQQELKEKHRKDYEDLIDKIGKNPETLKKIEQRYKEELFKELEKKKKKLAELRQLSQEEHKKVVDEMIKKKQTRQEEYEKLKQKPKLPKFVSEAYQKQSESLRNERHIVQAQKEKVASLLNKKKEFFESVKRPEPDQSKVEEMKMLKEKSHHKSRKRYDLGGEDEAEDSEHVELSYKQMLKKGMEFLKYSQAKIDKEKLKELEESKERRTLSADDNQKEGKTKEQILEERKLLVDKYSKKKKNPNDSMISNMESEAGLKNTEESRIEETVSNQDGQEKKPRNYLKEFQRERAKRMKDGEKKVLPEAEVWQKIKSSDMLANEKKILLKAEIARIEEHTKMREMEMKHLKKKFILPEDEITPVDEMYINAIKAKLSLLE